jgi:peptidoglycan-associated lipoprotein
MVSPVEIIRSFKVVRKPDIVLETRANKIEKRINEMKTTTTAIMLSATLVLSACSGGGLFNRDRFGGGADGSGVNNGIQTGALNPASPAYFAETIGDRVLFEVDQSTLTADARATLASQAQWLNTNTTYSAIVEGHADEQGTRAYNLALGSRRASAARDFLVSQGVADGRLQIVTFGKERPIEVCSTEDCYAKNRRSVTVVSAGVGS